MTILFIIAKKKKQCICPSDGECSNYGTSLQTLHSNKKEENIDTHNDMNK